MKEGRKKEKKRKKKQTKILKRNMRTPYTYTISNSYTLDSVLSFSVTEIEIEIELAKLAKRPSNKHHNVKCHQP